MNKQLMMVGIVVLLLAVGLSGCNDVEEMINPPNVDIISKNARSGYEGLDYVVYIDATVYNRGGDGKATVWAKVIQDSNEWSEKQTIYMDGGETRDLTFTFQEFSFWSSDSGNYQVWVE